MKNRRVRLEYNILSSYLDDHKTSTPLPLALRRQTFAPTSQKEMMVIVEDLYI